ncbi:MAG: dihydrodipicolinate synthase family protein [Oscillospiraceae bacterium]|jgi:4-hydroxy-tetrahydrodipicolinate synthase
MKNNFSGGVWPVMLTPFTADNKVDYEGLGRLTDWYIENGALGLFAVCQSSEMFFLSLEERVQIAHFVKERANGRVSVIASGHISDSFEDQVKEINAVAETGVAAVILITNRMAKQDESDDVWISNLEKLLKSIPESIKLGLYECPYPYKRVMTGEMTKWCAKSERFYFLKDTCCDIEQIKVKLEAIKGSNLKLYNANTATLLASLRAGATGYSGVMASFQCKLYAKLCESFYKNNIEPLSDILTISALIERQYYPVNAKFSLQEKGVINGITTRVIDKCGLTETFKEEVRMLDKITKQTEKKYL